MLEYSIIMVCEIVVVLIIIIIIIIEFSVICVFEICGVGSCLFDVRFFYFKRVGSEVFIV